MLYFRCAALSTYRCTPDRHWMHITLTLTTTTTMRMIHCVHSHTANGWSDVEPSASSRLSKLPEMPMRVAGDTDSTAGILADFAHFTTLKSNGDVHDLLAVLFLGDDGRVRACATAENCSFAGR